MSSAGLLPAWPLIGRDRELGELTEALRAGSVVVVASPGVGKSRLAREAVEVAERAGALTSWVQATRSAAAVPLGAFAALLPDAVRSTEPVELMRHCVELLHARAGGRRVVLGIDDAQLLDPVSAALTLHLVAHAAVGAVVTVRSGEPTPDAIQTLWKDGHARRLELGRLNPTAVDALVEVMLGGPAETRVLRWVADSAQGNPLYVRELVAGARASGSLRHVDGLWQLVGAPAVSPSLRELVGQRLDVLDAAGREPVELLALGEPLRLEELEALTSRARLLDAEAQGFVDLDARGDVRLAHPLFGDVIGAAIPALRGRALRLRLADVLARRAPITPDDALRVARLRIDAGAAMPPALLLDAAQAALSAGDPEFAGALAARAAEEDGSLPATLLLARSWAMRDAHAQVESVLADAEPLAPGHPAALEYLRQRTRTLHWGLHRVDDAVAVLERAASWSSDPTWAAAVRRLRLSLIALVDGFAASADLESELSAPGLSAGERRSLGSILAMARLYEGEGDKAGRIVRDIRPPLPTRSLLDAGPIAVAFTVPFETGADWPVMETFAHATLNAGARVGDHHGAANGAFALGCLCWASGRYHEAQRWLAESELHFRRHDPFGQLVQVHAYQVGVAAELGDEDAAQTGLARIATALHGRPPLPSQLVYVLRADAWAARTQTAALGAQASLAGAERLQHAPILAAQLAYEAVRCGAVATAMLRSMADRCDAPLVALYAAHAGALGDGDALEGVAHRFAALGALRYGMEAASQAAACFLAAGRSDSARRAAAIARSLHQPDQGTAPPTIDGLDAVATKLTKRETELVELARRGLGNAEIAERLVLSRRTVETHMYRAMQKLSVRDRREL